MSFFAGFLTAKVFFKGLIDKGTAQKAVERAQDDDTWQSFFQYCAFSFLLPSLTQIFGILIRKLVGEHGDDE